MIRAAKTHFRKDINKRKLVLLDAFILEYRRIAAIYLEIFWNSEIEYKGRIFSIKREKFDIPDFLPKSLTPKVETTLSARAVKCCVGQVLGIISSVVREKEKAIFLRDKNIKEGKPISTRLKLRIHQKISKPTIKNLNLEINSLCADFKECSGKFNGYLCLKYLGKRFGKIKIPIKYHRNLNKWRKGNLKKSFLISNGFVSFRYEIANKTKDEGDVVGMDTGMKSVVTVSNGYSTPKKDLHGHSLESIICRLSRRKKGSKNFRKGQEHRKNFIHWSINRINLKNIKKINLEKVININFGKHARRKTQAWTNTIIRDKVISLAEEQEVLVTLQDSTYRSQRCSRCGLVRKASRKKEVYECSHCGNVMNADLNAAKNHEIDLPEIPFALRKSSKNLKGFFWNPSGFSDFETEFTVPTSKK